MTCPTVLIYNNLTEDEQLKYESLANSIDTRLLQKFVTRTVPVQAGLLLFTGGLCMLVSGPLWMWRISKKAIVVDRARNYVDSLRRNYGCASVDWSTFPAAYVVIGGSRLLNDGPRSTCPMCKAKALQLFTSNSRRQVRLCSNCNHIMVVQYERGTSRPENFIIPGVCIVAIPSTIEHLDVWISTAIDAAEGLWEAILEWLASRF